MEAKDVAISLKEKEMKTKFGNKSLLKGDLYVSDRKKLPVQAWISHSKKSGDPFFYLYEDIGRERSQQGEKGIQLSVYPFNFYKKKDNSGWIVSSLLVSYEGLLMPMSGSVEGMKPNRTFTIGVSTTEYGERKGLEYQLFTEDG